jgi:hypothetical protein
MNPIDDHATSTSRSGPTVRTATEVVPPGIVEPAGLQLRTRDLPSPTRGQAMVAVESSGISFAEQSMRRGRYLPTPASRSFPSYPATTSSAPSRALAPGSTPPSLASASRR